jgi:hypothetical protein
VQQPKIQQDAAAGNAGSLQFFVLLLFEEQGLNVHLDLQAAKSRQAGRQQRCQFYLEKCIMHVTARCHLKCSCNCPDQQAAASSQANMRQVEGGRAGAGGQVVSGERQSRDWGT